MTVTLVARDESGQEAKSKPMKIVLPERRFNEPLARALIEQRRSLARDPSSAPLVAKALDALSIAPERFIPDRRNYLALSDGLFHGVARFSAKRRMRPTGRRFAAIAVGFGAQVEDGDTPQAQAELRAIQQKLMDALAKGAPDEEIERLLAQLRARDGAGRQGDGGKGKGPTQHRARRGRADRAPARSAVDARADSESWRGKDRARQRSRCCRSCRTCSRTCRWPAAVK